MNTVVFDDCLHQLIVTIKQFLARMTYLMTLHQLKPIFSNKETNKYQLSCHVKSRVGTRVCELIDTNRLDTYRLTDHCVRCRHLHARLKMSFQDSAAVSM
jgi:hypothetical protein